MRTVIFAILIIFATSVLVFAQEQNGGNELKNKDIISKLTLQEKIKMLTGANGMDSVGNEALGIRVIRMADGPCGVHRKNEMNICYPAPSLLANSFDRDLLEKVGKSIGYDCIEQGVEMLLAPATNIKRTPLCGRNFEYYSEDPILAGEMAAAFIKGVQSVGIATSLKHYAANNIEYHRDSLSSNVSERTLREIYLKPFEIAIKKSDPYTVMCAYNKINGVWCSENKWLLTDVLRGDFGFKGLMVSDWGAVHNHAAAFTSGMNLQMPQEGNIEAIMMKALEEKQITEYDIDLSVDKLISLADRIDPKPNENYDREIQRELASKSASESMVLLKNNGILPLLPEKVKKVAVFGPCAKVPVTAGSGSAFVPSIDGAVESPLEKLQELGENITFDYFDDMFPGGEPTFDHAKWAHLNGKVAEYDAYIFFVTNGNTSDGEAYDRNTINFDNRVDAMLHHFCGGHPTIVVMQTGGAMAPVLDWKHTASAVVQMGLAGECGGSAIARLLLGKENFSGKLSETYAYKLSDNPVNADLLDDPDNLEYKEGVFVGYRYFDSQKTDVLYPFGHGLSYTTFDYSDLKTDNKKLSFKIKNTGKYDGNEIAQIYVRPINSSNDRPYQELKDFTKVFLKIGEEKTVEININDDWFTYFSEKDKAFVKDNCKFEIAVCASSRDTKLSIEI